MAEPWHASLIRLWWLTVIFFHNQLEKAAGQFHTAVISANATQSTQYAVPVVAAYEPVNCTLIFSEAVNDFGAQLLPVDPSRTTISNFRRLDGRTFVFQASSAENFNVSLRVPAGAVTSVASGMSNAIATGFFSFEYFAYPPSFTISLDGFPAQSTNLLVNIVTLTFNSTMQHDSGSAAWISAADVKFTGFPEPNTIDILEQTSDRTFRFAVQNLESNDTANVSCVPAGTEPPTTLHKVFPCSACERYVEWCFTESDHLPTGDFSGTLEFPFAIIVGPITELRMPQTIATLTYDTYAPAVILEAPVYARDPFLITVTWSEPLQNLLAVRPTLGADSPLVNQVLFQNQTILTASQSYQVLVAPVATGRVTISITGSQLTQDLAGNSNDARIFVERAAGDRTVTQYSLNGGPPLQGTVSTSYSRPSLPQEVGTASGVSIPSLQVSWSGFTTAVRYDTFIQWGNDQSTQVITGITNTRQAFSNFTALLGVVYTVSVRAYSFYGTFITATSAFSLPDVQLVANGSFASIPLPNGLSNGQTPVEITLIVPSDGFLQLITQQVITFRTANAANGARDPCLDQSNERRCTFLNFELEVPNSHFTVFKQPIRMLFNFGSQGWSDSAFRPRLFYWEEYHDEWWSTPDTCPPEQTYDQWSAEHGVYEVSICHFSHFTIFEVFSPSTTTTTSARSSSSDDESFEDPYFWVIIIACILLLILTCCVCYWAFMHPVLEEKLPFSKLGIRSMSERLPGRFAAVAPMGDARAAEARETDLLVPAGGAPAAIADREEDGEPDEADLEGRPLAIADAPPAPAGGEEQHQRGPVNAQREQQMHHPHAVLRANSSLSSLQG